MIPWYLQAACRGMSREADSFFPDPRNKVAYVRDHVCAHCPVPDQCLEAALTAPFEPAGVWGGMLPADVQKLWRRRQREDRQRAPKWFQILEAS